MLHKYSIKMIFKNVFLSILYVCHDIFSKYAFFFTIWTDNVSSLATFIELTKLLPNVNQEQRNKTGSFESLVFQGGITN